MGEIHDPVYVVITLGDGTSRIVCDICGYPKPVGDNQ